MAQVIPEKYKDLFQKRAFASLSTLMPDGRPQVTPVWVDFDGEHVIRPEDGKKIATCAVIHASRWPLSIRKIHIAIWRSGGG